MKHLKTFPWSGLVLLLLTLVASNWVVDVIRGWIGRSFPQSGSVMGMLIAFVVFVVSIYFLYHYRKSFLGVRTLQQVKTGQSKCLVMFLSIPDAEPENWQFPITIYVVIFDHDPY
ncbi:MAG: hypothetical protein ACPL7I_06325 [Myxococcota bacterium]